MWIAIHTTAAAIPLVTGAVVLVGWAVVARGPLGVVPMVGLRVHRRGLVVVGIVLVALPVLSGHLTDPVAIVPCWLSGIVLGRMGMARWSPRSAAVADGAGHEPPTPAGSDLSNGTRHRIRSAGRATGRAGSVVARQADVAAPIGARAAGKIVGRVRGAPNR